MPGLPNVRTYSSESSSYITKNPGFNTLIVKSINDHWSTGLYGSALSSDSYNSKFGKRFIEPYSSFDDQSASIQMGKMHKIDPDEFRPGDILIRISSMVDSTGFNFFVKVKKFNSALEIASLHIPKDYDDDIRNTAKQWKNMKPLLFRMM